MKGSLQKNGRFRRVNERVGWPSVGMGGGESTPRPGGQR